MAGQILPPRPLLQPGVADSTDLRIKVYLQRRGVPVDSLYDGLTNLFNWSDKEQDRSNKEQKEIQKKFQAASDEARNLAQEINKKDLAMIQLTSERDALRQHAGKTEAKQKSAEEACQKAKSDLSKAQGSIKWLQQANQSVTRERDQKTLKISDLLGETSSLRGEIDDIKAASAIKLEAKQKEYDTKWRLYDAQLHTERQNLLAMAAQYKEALAAKDSQADLAAQRYQNELGSINTLWNSKWRMAIQEFDTQLETQAQKHQGEMGQAGRSIAEMVEKHAGEIKSREDQTAAVEARYRRRLAEVEGSVRAEIERAQREDRMTIRRQQQQIAAYTKDGYAPVDDAAFTKSFQALVQDVNRLASHARLPPTIDFDPALDPTGCLERHGGLRRSWIWPRFVRNLCWEVLLAGFFSLPFGFGALGKQGDGYDELRRMYQATARLLSPPTDDTDPVMAMPNEKDVSLYRASYMEKMLSAIRSDQRGATAGGEMAYAVVFQKNVDAVARRLYDTLDHIVNGQISAACLQQASAVAHKLGILALEMGTQRARIWLETCRYGEHSTPDEWKTEDGEETASVGGSVGGVMVDLMVHPCLSRVGDGRDDLVKKKVMAKGEFVPLR
ncbi:hypothetical protein B0T26DRAFT_755936 [Lasiosphaeria miniovina]|uniref:Uncharacterized protein n=1 Tax=Lasiosphaeria miniovina TaxID=1954250 RepID=A0AA40DMM9_9PEZI|nr:uncharacterized protein B0T26DRAFT_755936 [Lasiosphaeria miniovina]KAK0706432.1 hypothetical protein B0T26DRAFT_755936 [Lasiosphaeria miniovina]